MFVAIKIVVTVIFLLKKLLFEEGFGIETAVLRTLGSAVTKSFPAFVIGDAFWFCRLFWKDLPKELNLDTEKENEGTKTIAK